MQVAKRPQQPQSRFYNNNKIFIETGKGPVSQ
jgi:hypothetical protein